jgi:hypothetical protein
MNNELRENRKLNLQMSRLSSFYILFDFEIEAINSFLSSSNEMIQKKEAELIIKLKKWEEERHSHDNAPEPYEMYESEIINLSQFSRLAYNSFYLMAYTVFEKYMFDIAAFCQEIDEKKISAKDLNGKGYIDQCRRYFQNVIELDLTNLQTEWYKIKKYQTIRNLIAHKDSKIYDIDSDLERFIEATDGISYHMSDTSISIDSNEFIKNFTKTAQDYINKLTQEIDNKKNT